MLHRHRSADHGGIPNACSSSRPLHRRAFFQDCAAANESDSGDQSLKHTRLSGYVRLSAENQQVTATGHPDNGEGADASAMLLAFAVPADRRGQQESNADMLE